MLAQNRFLAYSIFFLLLAAMGLAYTDIEIVGARCLGDGQFAFTAQNRYPDPLRLEDTRIVMSHRELGTFSVQGSWNKDTIFQQTTSSQAATFTSTTGNLNQSGAYDGMVFFNGCKYPPCKEVFALKQCPEFKYSCDVSDLSIHQCFVHGDELWVRFSGLNGGQHQLLNPPDALAISIDSNARTLQKSPYVDGMRVVTDGEDTYTLKIPRKLNEKFYDVQLHVRQCRAIEDPTPALCVMNLKPLVERKLNESKGGGNATVEANATTTSALPTTSSPIRIKRVRDEEAPTLEASAPPTKKERKAVPPEPRVSSMLMTSIFLVWLLGLMVVIVLLFRDRRAS